jgi:hypothetical protein
VLFTVLSKSNAANLESAAGDFYPRWFTAPGATGAKLIELSIPK